MAYGFSYDHSSHDYKIVMIHQRDALSRIAHLQCFKRYTWKDRRSATFGWKDAQLRSRSLVNGILHWSALNANSSIMSFDSKEEKFLQTLLLPGPGPGPMMDETPSMAIGVVGECLRICIPSGDRNEYEVWMKEYGVWSSWTKLFRTESLRAPLLPFAATQDGTIIFDEETTYLGMYDLSEGRLSPGKRYSEKLLHCNATDAFCLFFFHGNI